MNEYLPYQLLEVNVIKSPTVAALERDIKGFYASGKNKKRYLIWDIENMKVIEPKLK